MRVDDNYLRLNIFFSCNNSSGIRLKRIATFVFCSIKAMLKKDVDSKVLMFNEASDLNIHFLHYKFYSKENGYLERRNSTSIPLQ